MAKGVAAMTMDEDYQQKRREAMNKQPAGLREGITRGGKGLVSVRNFPGLWTQQGPFYKATFCEYENRHWGAWVA